MGLNAQQGEENLPRPNPTSPSDPVPGVGRVAAVATFSRRGPGRWAGALSAVRPCDLGTRVCVMPWGRPRPWLSPRTLHCSSSLGRTPRSKRGVPALGSEAVPGQRALGQAAARLGPLQRGLADSPAVCALPVTPKHVRSESPAAPAHKEKSCVTWRAAGGEGFGRRPHAPLRRDLLRPRHRWALPPAPPLGCTRPIRGTAGGRGPGPERPFRSEPPCGGPRGLGPAGSGAPAAPTHAGPTEEQRPQRPSRATSWACGLVCSSERTAGEPYNLTRKNTRL